MRALNLIALSFAASLVLLSCQRPVQPVVTDQRLAPMSIPADAQLYSIDSERTEILIYVYRDGRLKRLGHNHIVSARDVAGRIYLSDRLESSAVELRLPVDRFEVDRPDLRARAGEDFAAPIDANSIAGTRSNMLSEALLDSAQWPDIVLVSRAVRGALPELELQMDAAIKATVQPLKIPLRVELIDDELVATGAISVTHAELGLVPFSALLGALTVRDQLDLQFTIFARPLAAD